MQAWELERELFKAKDKLSAIATYIETHKYSLGFKEKPPFEYPHYKHLKAILQGCSENRSTATKVNE